MKIQAAHGNFLSVDYTHPSAVNPNAEFYCLHGLPFVMGTTGGDRQKLEDTVRSSAIAAVVAPNMAKQIVGFQAMMEYAAQTFPDLFKGYRLSIRESHQQTKADTSGTAKAMVRIFNRLGTPFTEDQIRMERDPQIQKTAWGIPEEHLGGHAWHTYTLVSEDGTVRFEFTHNVNGREIYVQRHAGRPALPARPRGRRRTGPHVFHDRRAEKGVIALRAAWQLSLFFVKRVSHESRLTKIKRRDTFLCNCDTGDPTMPISLRIPPKKEELINRAAKKEGKTKTAFILDAVYEKLRLVENREQTIRRTAGWLSPKEASRLSEDLKVFEKVDEADWQ